VFFCWKNASRNEGKYCAFLKRKDIPTALNVEFSARLNVEDVNLIGFKNYKV
jgi:hypothetical protein